MEALLGRRTSLGWVLLAIGVAGCGAAAQPEPRISPVPERGGAEPAQRPAPVVDRPEQSRPRADPGSGSVPAPETPDACRDELGGALAKRSCDGKRILVAHPIELAPSRSRPTEPTRSVLSAVAELLRREDSIVFVRIEVFATEPAGGQATRRREQTLAAQARADALFQYLWRKLGVDAERMEAVGYPYDPRRAPAGKRFDVVLRIVQHQSP